jgi:Carbohydrate-selective porin, OprB family
MSKFKASIFSLTLLSAIGITSPAFAETATISQPSATTPVEPATAVKGTNDLPTTAAPQVAVNSDEVAPTDRNVQILKSLDSRYQCGIGKLDQVMSRDEFANNISICLSAIEVKMAQNSGAVAKEDVAQLKELTNNFLTEISALNTRVEAVEKKVALAQNSSTFSTTTKLVGEVIIGLNTFSSQTGKPASDTNGGSTVVTNRVRLNFDTSFTGKDRLRTRLESRNNIPFNSGNFGTPPVSAINGGTGTNTTRLGWDGDEGNTTNLSLLQYTLPVFDKSKLVIDAVGSEFNENMYTFNPLLAPAAVGSISRFGRFNPVYRQSGLGTAATLDYKFDSKFTGSIGYAVPLAAPTAPGLPGTSIAANPVDSTTGGGIFGGNYAAIAQLRYQVSPNTDLGLSFARSYHSNGAGVTAATGSAVANNPFGGRPTVANHYSFSASSKLSPGFVLSGWVGLTNASLENGGSTGSADIFNAALTASLPDLGGKGNALSFIVGIPPKVSGISSSIVGLRNNYNPDTALHLEALYKIKMSDNLYITPGVLLITSPESSPTLGNRGSEFVGTVRTTFFF